jgi:hypothetical protein
MSKLPKIIADRNIIDAREDLPNHMVSEVWDIIENNESPEFPFMLTCTQASGKVIIFPCRTSEEAYGKILAVAKELEASGHQLGLG